MERQNGTWKKKARNLVGTLLLGASSILRAEDFSFGPVTNNTTLVPIERTEYSVNASSSVGGNVSGNINDWVEQGSNATLNASADAHYKFVNWSGVPEGTSTNNPYSFTVDNCYTNIVANFAQKTNIFYDVGFSSISRSGNNINLQINDVLDPNSTYHIYSDTNLVTALWPERTNGVATYFSLPIIYDQEFFKAKKSTEE